MLENLVDDRLFLEAGDDVHGCTNAVGAGCTGTVTLATPLHLANSDSDLKSSLLHDLLDFG